MSWSLDHVGILVRTVDDAALMLQVMSGEDKNDPGSANEVVPNFAEQMAEHNRPPRIGIVSQYYQEKSTGEVWDHTQSVANKLADAGAGVCQFGSAGQFRVVSQCPANCDECRMRCLPRAFPCHAGSQLRPKSQGWYGDGYVDSGDGLSPSYAIAQTIQRGYGSVSGASGPVITPTTPSPAPKDRNTTGDASFQVPWTSSGLPTVTIPFRVKRGWAANGRSAGWLAI
ncbi:MAG: hypothetical protein CM1200mP22_19750 [Dehalococcoidia bacterium]|nr:MAG: hypothetical protein CM1200mP22_19750 [Dehalococcoidia bacterium]